MSVWQYGISMAKAKVTFTLDEATVNRVRDAAQRLAMPQSAIIRQAVEEYYERIGKLSEQERARMLRAFDDLVPKIPARPLRHVVREMRDIREARRSGGRKSPKEKIT